jgi:protein-S-isoprenylcysteine O-methyltransferase Ste14
MYLPIQLQNVVPRAWHLLTDHARILAGLSGLLFSRHHPLRATGSLLLLASGAYWLGFGEAVSARFAIGCFLAALVLRYAFLLGSFIRNGIATWLKVQLGAELGFFVHESISAVLSFAQRLSFVAMLCATSTAPSGPIATALVSLGVVLVLVGVGVTTWATRVLGLDAYYYRDLFMGPEHVSVVLRGPYTRFANPMYGLGQLAAYGAALVALSPIGFVAAALNQVALYLFNDTIEQPRLRAANSGWVEAQLRYALARTGFDPRSEIGAGRRSRPPARLRRRA